MGRTTKDLYSKQARVLAGAFASAVAADERDDGCDIAAGLFGSRASALLECVARELVNASQTVTRFEPVVTELKDGSDEPGYLARR